MLPFVMFIAQPTTWLPFRVGLRSWLKIAQRMLCTPVLQYTHDYSFPERTSAGESHMSRHDNQAHLGFTVIELLIVIAIVSLLFQIMLPAIETSREAARRTQCANNLRQVGLATAGYESAHKLLPPAFRSRPHAHNFVAYLLPYFEERSIDEVYDFDKDWDADENKPAAEHDISVLRCPSSSRKQHWTSDYAIYRYVEQTLYHKLVHEKLIFRRKSTRGALQSKEIKMARITDGISKTVFVCE